jgi:hypothetical protein
MKRNREAIRMRRYVEGFVLGVAVACFFLVVALVNYVVVTALLGLFFSSSVGMGILSILAIIGMLGAIGNSIDG